MKKTIFLTLVLFLITTILASAADLQSGPAASLRYTPNEIIVKFRQPVADAIEQQIKEAEPGSTMRLSRSLDELNTTFGAKRIIPLFKNFKAGRQRLKNLMKKDRALLSERERRILRRLKRAPKGAKVPGLDRIYKIEFDLGPNQSLEEIITTYSQNPSVEYAELNYTVSACETPDDPYYPLQWSLNNIGQEYPESGKYNPPPGMPDCDIDAPEAWDIQTGSAEVIVAVLDTGVDYTHRDMQANMWVNTDEIPNNGLDDDDNGYVDDIYGYDFYNEDGDPTDDDGHGTHCAGIIAAGTNNGLDIAGVCWDAKIMAVKFLGVDTVGTMDLAAGAIFYAVDNGADILSNSWGARDGCGGPPQSLEEAINYAHSQGVVVVASAGNSDSTTPHYPAYYNNVISVAATNSNDEKAPFSTYGNWVDIAAPGVDVLSLLASGTDKGVPYDAYTTVMSGTSMAGPHVAGACALILSIYPGIEVNEVNEILQQSTDPISPEICASGRLNLHTALQIIADYAAGVVTLDEDVYSCFDTIKITVRDSGLVASGTQEVSIGTSGGDFETVMLTETAAPSGNFKGTILTASGTPDLQDGLLQLLHDEVIVVVYIDVNDGTGNPAVAIDIAIADCQAPFIFNVEFNPYPPGTQLTISFETDEPTTARILCGLTCEEPYAAKDDDVLQVAHSITLTDEIMQPYTVHFFTIEVNDVVSNTTEDSNDGNCYVFVTSGPKQMNVPVEFETIQEAIDLAWEGSTVCVADGTYVGQGNKNIDFKGKAITLRSENGPENCIIDCEEDGLSFYFHGGETTTSHLQGFTMQNGGQLSKRRDHTGIWCEGSSPTITNCVLTNNSAYYDGGIFCDNGSSPKISDCAFVGNSGLFSSGVRCHHHSSPTIDECTFTAGNSCAIYCEHGSDSNPVIENCLIYNNRYTNFGGSIRAEKGCNPIVSNCIITGNYAANWAAGLRSNESSPILVNCTIANNISIRGGGGIYCWNGSPIITNCIIWGNKSANSQQMDLREDSNPILTYCDIQGGWPGLGNIDTDPCFFFSGYWDPNGTPTDTHDDFWVDGDYHLKSEGWRWDIDRSVWTWDDVTSHCIDAGNPGSPLGDEPNSLPVDPNNEWGINKRINIGCYGGTAEASMPPYDWALLADLNNDGMVNLEDFGYFSNYWRNDGSDLPADLDRNKTISPVDLELFIEDWLQITSWY